MVIFQLLGIKLPLTTGVICREGGLKKTKLKGSLLGSGPRAFLQKVGFSGEIEGLGELHELLAPWAGDA